MERKIVKLRVDMYNDTKFKIIDTMEDRDVIHYIWTRLLTLAGKVNLEGDLYLSKSIPYTVGTLALEFNRSAEKVKLALKVFIDLEMVELIEDNVYRVKNFVKHQNIKSKKEVDIAEKVECNEEKLSDINSAKVNKNLIEKIDNNDLKDKVTDVEYIVNKDIGKSIFDFEKEKQNNNNMVLNISEDIENKNNNIKVIELNNDKKSNADLAIINVKDNSKIQSENISDKSVLDKNLLNNEVSVKDKANLDKEFVFSKADNKKKRNKSKKQKRKEEESDIISIWDGDDIEDICGLSDEVPEGKLITTFKV
ncbi:phage replisome organizer N-terminal domain-containing protein [Clostridium taeniosporum]|uniref:Phage replisome organiser N-terminal domain-containing protein n=1 Tax=Clostridium taeniosporum TaxID=394958 RepID=A0A1D7XNQ7_9CLOT|nr:phage replisome organizer N-terminal domain-containing protein [Clostridium taeniosporum]AOR24971.1 hypothetical protein BGI42_12885 [Clostridium taeniosporum]